MGRFKNLGIRAKLIAGFSTVLLLMVVVGVVGVYGLRSVNTEAAKMYEFATVPLKELGIARAKANEDRALALSLLIEQDPDLKAKTYEKMAENDKLIEENLGLVANSLQTEKAKQLYATLQEHIKGFEAARDEVLKSTDEGASQDETFALWKEKVLPEFGKVAESFGALFDSKTELAHKSDIRINDTYKRLLLVSIALILAALIAGGAIAFVLSGRITSGLKKMLVAATAIAEGDVGQSVDVTNRDEIGQLAAAFTQMIDHLGETAAVADRIADGDLSVEVTARSPQDRLGNAFATMITNLRALVGELQAVVETASSSSEQLSATSTEAGRAVGEIALAVSSVAEGAERQSQLIGEARGSSTIAQETARSGEATAQRMVTVMNELAEKSARITGIVAAITGIAEQTNLLALNAAIEAARAGEQGRGFAVVAEEVRKLAEESQQAAGSISELIGEIQTASSEAVRVVNEEALSAFRTITEGISGVATTLDEVASVAESTSASAEQVSASSQETSASTEEIAASADELARTAESLQELVNRFSLTGR